MFFHHKRSVKETYTSCRNMKQPIFQKIYRKFGSSNSYGGLLQKGLKNTCFMSNL